MVTTETIEKHIYFCEICGGRYGTKHEAEECEARGTTEPKFKVGDEVQITVTNFANKRLLGKTGIIEGFLYKCPKYGDKTELHNVMCEVRLDVDGDIYTAFMNENILELK